MVLQVEEELQEVVLLLAVLLVVPLLLVVLQEPLLLEVVTKDLIPFQSVEVVINAQDVEKLYTHKKNSKPVVKDGTRDVLNVKFVNSPSISKLFYLTKTTHTVMYTFQKLVTLQLLQSKCKML